MLCYTVERYDRQSLGVDSCPATCKLRDVVMKKSDCDEYGENTVLVAKEKSLAVLRSPNHACSNSTKYHRSEICVYNISLSCSTDYVVISRQPEHTHLAIDEGDFVQVVDYTHERVYGKVNGEEWPRSQAAIYSSNFVLVFWSEPHWKPAGSRGFRVHMECASSSNNSTNVPQSEESGSAEIILT